MEVAVRLSASPRPPTPHGVSNPKHTRRWDTSGAVIGHKYERYARSATSENRRGPTLDALDVTRICCRRMFLGHVDMTADMLCYAQLDSTLDDCGSCLKREVRARQTVSCD